MSIPKKIIAELNRPLFKFLWNDTDTVTRLSIIKEYDRGGLKMIELALTTWFNRYEENI